MINAERAVSAKRKDWKISGWQGITAQTPEDWNLAGYGGDSRTGNMRLDSGITSGAAGLEVRWSQPKGVFSDAELEKRLTPFLSTIIKAARKGKSLAKTESHAVKDSRFPERDAQRSFGWQGERKGLGRIWHCADCGRLCIAQVVGQPGRDFSAVAQDILGSLRCHSAEIGWRTWALYDLVTQAPVDYQLKGQPQLMNVFLQLILQNGQSQDIIQIEQWSMAGIQVKDAYLDEWYRSKNVSSEALLRYESSEGEVNGHPALHLTGRRSGWRYWLGYAPAQWVKLHQPAPYFDAILWECPESNKITLVQTFSRHEQPSLIKEIVERTSCH